MTAPCPAPVLAAAGVPEAAAQLRALRPKPVIDSVQIDETTNRLYVIGSDFGDEEPLVVLGGQTLLVEAHTVDSIIALVPEGLDPATYPLTVSLPQAARLTASVDVTVGAAGPPGEPGLPGDQNWSVAGDDLYRESGCVGIGTPGAPLHIAAAVDGPDFRVTVPSS